MTYSIVARCPETGHLGVAVQSHFFGVGAIVPWVEAGVGAVATQATAEIAHGPDGLTRLRAGRSASEALGDLMAADPQGDTRQVGIVDAVGRAAAHTGSSCIAHAGHVVGEGFSVQANMMDRPGVPEAMAAAFSEATGELAERLLAALDAAQAAGGDIRGQQSAALVIGLGEEAGRAGHDRVVDLRVEDHPAPLVELRRLVGVHRAYRRVDEAEQAMGDDDLAGALSVYEESIAAQPQLHELVFWQAVLLAGLGREREARSVVAPVFARHDGDRWRELVCRLPATGLIGEQAADALLSAVDDTAVRRSGEELHGPVTLAFVGHTDDGRLDRAAAYEDAVLPLLADHGGQLLYRGQRAKGQDPSLPAEVHLIRFASRVGYDAYLADQRRAVLLVGHGDVFSSKVVVELESVVGPVAP